MMNGWGMLFGPARVFGGAQALWVAHLERRRAQRHAALAGKPWRRRAARRGAGGADMGKPTTGVK
jgi:hypothetical protein